jgi:hypothetical protein
MTTDMQQPRDKFEESVMTMLVGFGNKLDDLQKAIFAVEKVSATSTRVDNIRMEVQAEKEERHKLERLIEMRHAELSKEAAVEIAKIRTFVWGVGMAWTFVCAIVVAGWAIYTYTHPHP